MSTTKTIREWLKELPEPYRSKAISNDIEAPEAISSSLSSAIGGAFSWEDSPEGWEYWNNVRTLAEYGAFDNMANPQPLDTSAPLGTGKRFNEGKTRHDLVPAYAQEQYARVLTYGAKKYSGKRNWEEIGDLCTCDNRIAIPKGRFTQNQCAGVATKSIFDQQTLSTQKGREPIAGTGLNQTEIKKEKETKNGGLQIEKGSGLLSSLGQSGEGASQLSQQGSFSITKDQCAQYAEADQAQETGCLISTTATKQETPEGFCAENVTWGSVSLETAMNWYRGHSHICLIRQLDISYEEMDQVWLVMNERNWENGMAWSKVISSLERHLQAIKRGEDYDKESGLLHAAHVMCNAAFLTEYYKIYPQGDDRPHWYLKRPRIALDIDEVLADWVGHWTKHHGQVTPEFWNFDAKIKEKFDAKKDDKDFWLSIPALIDPKDLPFEPCCYVTSRNIPTEWTEKWIASRGFPTMPVITVGHGQSKVQVLKDNKIDIFVDDRFENFAEINSAGICCYLMDAPHNRRYEVGHKRIKSLKELVER